MLVTPKAWEATKAILVCVAALLTVFVCCWILEQFEKTFVHESGVLTSEPPALYRVTAYCPKSCCTGKWADGITASGKPAVGLIVAAPSDTKFGTVLDIPGYGRATVRDRGGAIKGNRLDVLFPTHQEALNWGVQYLKVRIVK